MHRGPRTHAISERQRDWIANKITPEVLASNVEDIAYWIWNTLPFDRDLCPKGLSRTEKKIARLGAELAELNAKLRTQQRVKVNQSDLITFVVSVGQFALQVVSVASLDQLKQINESYIKVIKSMEALRESAQ
jgi:hypothetical protein